ncbi:hypothetical protein MF406_14335 [Georgenia sp. TF02-10]|uniref:hypothetical protein n=1 Tax=Georgenia sp. TF02-10 TaxID=2917725 RepID=UPI001FA78B93|nr:hypothetical protein [Georgenia sp. TF02-10]UNX54110.1 hypothetical protein MF406_14335 [Georgenia sp. TF02-10]
MSENPFAAPASASGIQWSDLKGRLLVIEPLGVEHDIQTAFGSTDAVRANVYAIDGEPEEFLDALVFPRVLRSQLAPKVGAKVLGRLTTGNAKPSQSPPWLIAEPSEADLAAGKAWLASRQSQQFAAPAAAQQQPVQQQAAAGMGAPPF